VQIHGGTRLLRGSAVERLYRDVRYYGLEEGSSEIERMLVAKGALEAK
jgi:alkylation response protein AidB-like acyl-CoA dehydrogenase